MRTGAEITDAQAMSQLVAIEARMVHNATDSTGSRIESASSLTFADDPPVSSNSHLNLFVLLVQLWCSPLTHSLSVTQIQHASSRLICT